MDNISEYEILILLGLVVDRIDSRENLGKSGQGYTKILETLKVKLETSENQKCQKQKK